MARSRGGNNGEFFNTLLAECSPTLARVADNGGREQPGPDGKRPPCGGLVGERVGRGGCQRPSAVAATAEFAFAGLAFGALVAFAGSADAASKCPLVARRKREASPFTASSRRMAA